MQRSWQRDDGSPLVWAPPILVVDALRLGGCGVGKDVGRPLAKMQEELVVHATSTRAKRKQVVPEESQVRSAIGSEYVGSPLVWALPILKVDAKKRRQVDEEEEKRDGKESENTDGGHGAYVARALDNNQVAREAYDDAPPLETPHQAIRIRQCTMAYLPWDVTRPTETFLFPRPVRPQISYPEVQHIIRHPLWW